MVTVDQKENYTSQTAELIMKHSVWYESSTYLCFDDTIKGLEGRGGWLRSLVKKRSSHGLFLIEHLESSSTKVMMREPNASNANKETEKQKDYGYNFTLFFYILTVLCSRFTTLTK